MSTGLKIGLAVVGIAVVGGAGLFVANELDWIDLWYIADKGEALKEYGCCTPFCQETTKSACESTPEGSWSKFECSSVEECVPLCCTPFCRNVNKLTCDSGGGTRHPVTCDQVEECDVKCCLPLCDDMSPEICRQKGGTPSDTTCAKVNECVEGCCTPECEDTTQAICSMLDNSSFNKNTKCADLEECETVCCKPEDRVMSKKACQMAGGTFEETASCPGFYASPYATKIIQPAGHADYGEWEFYVDAHTCAKTIESEWQGEISFDWLYLNPEVPPIQGAKHDITFTPGADGSFTTKIETLDVFGQITGNYIEVWFEMPFPVGEVRADGFVHNGLKRGMDCTN